MATGVFTEIFELVRGLDQQRLAALAETSGIPQHLQSMLRQGSIPARLQAAETLVWLLRCGVYFIHMVIAWRVLSRDRAELESEALLRAVQWRWAAQFAWLMDVASIAVTSRRLDCRASTCRLFNALNICVPF
jgi:hypothetical protein